MRSEAVYIFQMAMLPSSEPERNRTPPGYTPRHHIVDVCTAPLALLILSVSLGDIEGCVTVAGPRVAAQYQSPLSSAQIFMELS